MAGTYLAAVMEGTSSWQVSSYHIDGWTSLGKNAFIRKCISRGLAVYPP